MIEIVDINFKLTSEGIHLLRNKYSYQIITYEKVENSYLVKGKSVKNWIIVLTFGIVFLTFSIILLYYLISGLSVDDKSVRLYNIFGNGLIGIIVLAVTGIISIISALKPIPIIVIVAGKKFYKLRLLKNQKNLDEVVLFFISYRINVERGTFKT